MDTTNTNVLTEQSFIPEIEKRQAELDDLRRDGVTKIEELKNEIANLKKYKQLDKETKDKLIAKDKEEIKKADIVRLMKKPQIAEKVKAAIDFIQASYSKLIAQEKAKNEGIIKAALTEKETKLAQYKKDNEEARKTYTAEWANKKPEAGKEKEFNKQKKRALDDLKVEYVQKCNDANVAFQDVKDECQDRVHTLYVNKFSYREKINNKKLPPLYRLEQKKENYVNNFTVKGFLLKNGLYLTILLLIIIATIVYAVQSGEFLLNGSNLILILNTTAPRRFLALGVAGLIVLAGTDLSIGRLVGRSAVFTGRLVTTSGTTALGFFGHAVNFFGIPLGLRVVLAFLLSIASCTAISGLAGFFSAKFKRHPFISTLATQLFTFGLMAGRTSNQFTGRPDEKVAAIISGKGLRDGTDFPIMIFWAIIGIAVRWVIWNKTKFGKNRFAVGGNPEAAAVSGINVFKVTLGVFILAGIYYGIGGSIFAIYSGNVRARTGQGRENDAIAACVVGGVSFSGGVGKISGVVIGALIFQAICVILPMIGITDANYQLAIKGVIILAAVTLDCIKYLKKK